MKDFKIVWSSRSECGPNRKKNEDTIFPPISGSSKAPFKAAVCDGLGGHVNGDIASKIAAETLSKKDTNLSQIISDANKNILDFQKSLTDNFYNWDNRVREWEGLISAITTTKNS